MTWEGYNGWIVGQMIRCRITPPALVSLYLLVIW
jgi:hypothetical protein